MGSTLGNEPTSIEKRISDVIAANDNRKGHEMEWWQKVERSYLNEERATGVQVGELPPLHIPLMQIRADKMIHTIHDSFFVQNPVFQLVPLGETHPLEASNAEDTLHAIFMSARPEPPILQAVTSAAVVGVGITRIFFDADIGLTIHQLHPSDFLIYPFMASMDIPMRAKYPPNLRMCGHRFWRTRGDVERLWGVDLKGTQYVHHAYDSNPENSDAGRADQDSESVELYEIYYRDNEYSFKRCIFAVEAKKIIFSEDWNLPLPYVEWRFQDTWGDFWPKTSICRKLQPIQQMYSSVFNIVTAGSMMKAFPPLISSGGPPGQGDLELAPGRIHFFQGERDFTTIPLTFNAGELPGVIEKLEGIADGVIGMSQIDRGQHLQRATATEVMALQDATGAAERQYFNYAERSMRQVGYLVLEYIRTFTDSVAEMYDLIMPYGDDLTQDFEAIRPWPDWLFDEYLVEPVGKTLTNSPGLIHQKLQILLGMAQNPEFQGILDKQKIVMAVIANLNLPYRYKHLIAENVAEGMSIEQAMQVAGEAEAMGLATPQGAAQGLGGSPQQMDLESMSLSDPTGMDSPLGPDQGSF